MTFSRIFLGWESNFLLGCSNYLIKEYSSASSLNLDNLCLVFPTSRASRRFIDIFLSKLDKTQFKYTVPELHTLSSLYRKLTPDYKYPNHIETYLTLKQAIEESSPETLKKIFKREVKKLSSYEIGDLIQLIENSIKNSIGDGISFSEISETINNNFESISDYLKWEAFEDIFFRYLKKLQLLNLKDIYFSRSEACNLPIQSSIKKILLCGMVEISPTILKILEKYPVDALIFGKTANEQGFTEYGTLNYEYWREYREKIPEDKTIICESEKDEVEKILIKINECKEKYSLLDISVGVCNENISTIISDRLAEFGVKSHIASGKQIKDTSIYLLITQLQKFYFSLNQTDFRVLIRNPIFYSWLQNRYNEYNNVKQNTLLYSLDILLGNYYSNRIHFSDSFFSKLEENSILQIIKKELIDPFFLNEKAIKILPSECIDKCMVVFKSFFENLNNLDFNNNLHLIQFIETFFSDFLESDILIDEINITDLLGFLINACTKTNIPNEFDTDALEILGWLELPLDDSKFLIVTGLSDKYIPSNYNDDSLLPNTLRKLLGLPNNETRYARDNYLLCSLKNSKKEFFITIPRKDLQNNPVYPSRLIYSDPLFTSHIITRFFGEETTDSLANKYQINIVNLDPGNTKINKNQLFVPLSSKPNDNDLQNIIINRNINVSSIGDFLKCPYRFYLKHILQLEPSKGGFDSNMSSRLGEIAHNALCSYSKALETKHISINNSTINELSEVLSTEMDKGILSMYSGNCSSIIKLQSHIIKGRFTKFIEWDIEQIQNGWSTLELEKSLNLIKWEVPNLEDPFFLTGRIDRIDYHLKENRVRIIDYKLSDKEKNPNKIHTYGKGTDMSWIDVQLPLYKFLLEQSFKDITPKVSTFELAYVNITGLNDEVFKIGEWTEKQLEDCKNAINKALTSIHNKEFWPPNEDYGKHSAYDPFSIYF